MGWLDDLFGSFSKKPSPVKATTEKKPIPEKPLEEVTVEEELAIIINQALEKNARNIFFDPEEEKCFVYSIDDEEVNEILTLELDKWQEILPALKSINMKIGIMGDKKFFFGLNISLTNLGERVTLILLKPGSRRDDMKEEKRTMIRAVNKLKPATSMTRQNIENLISIIDSRSEKPGGSVYELFVQEKLITREESDRYRQRDDYVSLIKSPFPRKQIVNVIAQWLGTRYFDVEMEDYDSRLAKILPEDIARKYNILLIEEDDEKIKAAFGNPFDINAVKEVEEKFSKKVEPFIACEEDIRYELEKVFEKFD